jgi:hypothetical protein
VPAGKLPIGPELVPVLRCPLDDQAENTRRQRALEHRKRGDVDYGALATVAHMEVRRRVITLEHRHDNAEESTDLRQRNLHARPS